ncbi:hypothetical protein V8F20_011368 [Naviculisporaceae sp. PSN 640]
MILPVAHLPLVSSLSITHDLAFLGYLVSQGRIVHAAPCPGLETCAYKRWAQAICYALEVKDSLFKSFAAGSFHLADKRAHRMCGTKTMQPQATSVMFYSRV